MKEKESVPKMSQAIPQYFQQFAGNFAALIDVVVFRKDMLAIRGGVLRHALRVEGTQCAGQSAAISRRCGNRQFRFRGIYIDRRNVYLEMRMNLVEKNAEHPFRALKPRN